MKSVFLSQRTLSQLNPFLSILIMIKFTYGEEKELLVDILLFLTNFGNYKMASFLKSLKMVKSLLQDSVIVLLYLLKNTWLFMEEFLKLKFLMIGIAWTCKLFNGKKLNVTLSYLTIWNLKWFGLKREESF